MNQLSSITYINAASIPFAKVNLDGNTLMVGANGAGKTTVLRSALYFYGVHENSALGINIRKKKGFAEYYFHELNSFIAYRYSNSFGNVLVVAYRSGSSNVKFKFVLETKSINDMELFLENKIARSPEELWKRLNELGYSVSESISKLSDYRNIIYGHSGDAYKKYAFFNSKDDYNNFIHVLSNIFINSKLDASSIQKTISNAISGFEPIDLEQIDRSIDDFRQKYDDVTKFEANKGTVDDILNALMEYEQFNTQSQNSMNQLLSNKKAFLRKTETLKEKIIQDDSLLEELSKSFEVKHDEYDKKIKIIEDKITILISQIKTAEKKILEYKDNQIDEKLKLYATKEKVQTEYRAAQKKLEELTSTQTTIKEKFIKLRETEKASYEQKLRNIEKKILEIKEEFQDKREQIDLKAKGDIQKFNDNFSSKLRLLKESLKDVNHKKDDALKDKIEAENKIFLQDEIRLLSNKNADDKESYMQTTNDVETYKVSLENINTNISSIENEQELRLDSLRNPYKFKIQKFSEEIEELNKFLDVNKDSFLGFIKEIEHPHEEIIVSLLKNEVLLDTTLEPSYSGATDTLFGLTMDINNLEASNYSKENILNKIKELEFNIKSLEEKLKTEEDELNNTFKNKLNELRRKYRIDKELLDIDEIKLPKFKSEYLKSEDELKELKQESQKLRDEAVLSMEKRYEKSKSQCTDSENKLKSYEHEQKTQISAIEKSANSAKSVAKEEKDQNIKSLTSAKSSEEDAYRIQISSIDSDEAQALLNDGVDEKLLFRYKDEFQSIKSQLEKIDIIEESIQQYKHDEKEHFKPLSKKRLERDNLLINKKGEEEKFGVLKDKQNAKVLKLSSILEKNRTNLKEINSDLESMKKSLDVNPIFKDKISKHIITNVEANSEKLEDILLRIGSLEDQAKQFIDNIRIKQDLLYRNFSPDNSLDLILRIDGSVEQVVKNAYELKNFMLDGKFEQFQEGVSSLFSLTINQLTKQTESLLEARQSVDGIVNKIRNMLRNLEGISVIDSIDLRTQQSNNSLLVKLEKLQSLNDEYNLVAKPDLFNFDKPKNKNSKEAIQIIIELRKELDRTNKKELLLDDTYALEIKASENGNDTGWQVSLDEVGSNGTDVMIKAVVNIAMLSISLGFKASSESKTYFHCILDEIGVLHPSYLKELISFANNKHIRFLNGAPNRQLVSSFRRIYILTNKNQNTMVKPLLSKQ